MIEDSSLSERIQEGRKSQEHERRTTYLFKIEDVDSVVLVIGRNL